MNPIQAHREYILRQELAWHKGKALEWLTMTHFVPALHKQMLYQTGDFHQYLYQVSFVGAWHSMLLPCIALHCARKGTHIVCLQEPAMEVPNMFELGLVPICIGPAVSNEDAFRHVKAFQRHFNAILSLFSPRLPPPTDASLTARGC